MREIYRIKKVNIPVSKLEVGEVLPFNLLDSREQVLLRRGQVVTPEFMERIKEEGYSSFLAEIWEEDE